MERGDGGMCKVWCGGVGWVLCVDGGEGRWRGEVERERKRGEEKGKDEEDKEGMVSRAFDIDAHDMHRGRSTLLNENQLGII